MLLVAVLDEAGTAGNRLCNVLKQCPGGISRLSVTAYRPLYGRALVILMRPEQAVGQVLALAGTVTLAERIPGKFLGLVHGLKGVQSVGQQAGDCGREGAARAVITVRQAVPGKGFQQLHVRDTGC